MRADSKPKSAKSLPHEKVRIGFSQFKGEIFGKLGNGTFLFAGKRVFFLGVDQGTQWNL